jgi:phosphoribosylformylglycinamidine synthase I
MSKPKAIILSGYGLNCEEETAFAFASAGAQADIVHINDLASNKKMLEKYQILAVPGGFSYGDDTGSGKAYANKLKNSLEESLKKFTEADKLIIGICNGFQILTQAGLLPGALTFNDNNRYTDRWVDLKMTASVGRHPERSEGSIISPWLKEIKTLSVPIAHGEGKFHVNSKDLTTLKRKNQIVGVYYKGEICKYQDLPANPNGSLENIAMITSENGRILGTMPHPERAMFFTQLPNWPVLKEKLSRDGKKLPTEGPGIQIFKNAVQYFT